MPLKYKNSVEWQNVFLIWLLTYKKKVNMMEVQDWGGGLTQHEVEAIEKIKQAF